MKSHFATTLGQSERRNDFLTREKSVSSNHKAPVNTNWQLCLGFAVVQSSSSMSDNSRRFKSLEKPIETFIEEQKNKNTLSKTRRDVSLLKEFLLSKNESRKVEEISPEELNVYIE